MAFDQIGFLNALKTYLTTNAASVTNTVEIVPNLEPIFYHMLRPPFIVIKDGALTPQDMKGCRWRASVFIRSVQSIAGKPQDVIVGRPSTSTYYGVLYMTQIIVPYLESSIMQYQISLTGAVLDGGGIIGIGESESILPNDKIIWQAHTITAEYDIRLRS